jgi:hypothetical protein
LPALYGSLIFRANHSANQPGNAHHGEQLKMITLHRFGPFLGAPDSSPFVIKTMMLLNLAGLEYRAVQGNPFKAPLRFLPTSKMRA